MEYVHSVIMQSGDTHKTYRNEVRDDMLLLAGEAITAVLAGQKYFLPDDCTLEGEAYNESCIVLRLSSPQPEVGEPLTIATVALAEHALAGLPVWRWLHEHQISGCALATHPDDAPSEPWCAIRFQNGADRYAEEAQHLLLFYSALAWAWLALSASDIYQPYSQDRGLPHKLA